MARLVIRNLEEGVKAGLKYRADRHGHGLEAEPLEILRNAVRNEALSTSRIGSS